MLFNLTRHSCCVEPFVQYSGIDSILEILEKSNDNVSIIYDCFNIFSNIIDGNDEYKRIMLKKKVTDLINKIIQKSAYLDKKIEFEGRSNFISLKIALIFNINQHQLVLDAYDDPSFHNIKVEDPIKPMIKNFLVSGKIVTWYQIF